MEVSPFFAGRANAKQNTMRSFQKKTKEMDTKERKKQQNRMAQRTYRRNQKLRMRALEEAVAHSSTSIFSFQNDYSSLFSQDPICTTISLSAEDSIISPISLLGHDEVSASPALSCLAIAQSKSTTVQPALHRAVASGNQLIVQLLLDRGVNVMKHDSLGRTALHLAVENGDEEMVKSFLEVITDLNLRDSLGRTALFEAIKRDNESMVQLLLEAAVDVHAKDNFGDLPLHWAVDRGSENLTTLLLMYGADIDA